MSTKEKPPPHPTLSTESFSQKANGPYPSSTYDALELIEEEVENLEIVKKSEDMENYLWNYPLYRSFVESDLFLDEEIESGMVDELLGQALTQSKKWIDSLMIPEKWLPQVRLVCDNVWLKFRTALLKRAGSTPFRSVK